MITRTAFALSSTVTRVITDRPSGIETLGNRRGLQFLVESQELTLGQRPVDLPVDGKEEIPEIQIPDSTVVTFAGQTGNFIAVGLSVQGLTPGQKLALIGKRPNLQVVDNETLAQRTRDYVLATDPGDVDAIGPLIAQLQALMQPPADPSNPNELGGLILDAPVGAREPLSGHTFELLDQLSDGPSISVYSNASVPTKVWRLRSRTGATGTATLPFFAVDTVAAAASGETIAEIRQIAALFQGTSRMLLQLDKPLSFIYDRGTLTLSANVADATNGETVANETLGSGNPAVANQTFQLKKPPLTFTSSPEAPSGAQSTLTVRVNGRLKLGERSLRAVQLGGRGPGLHLPAGDQRRG